MENNFFKSVIDADDAPVVICDLEHTIVYMLSLIHISEPTRPY